ncbi:hypothetical protein XELAEV_18043905mg [Xenopus laevis]|uniref:Uncharacterized protein n=1 Tax=Xenopus laevis TaxID=8355 RepID=A0A974BXW3_XENLA|nr:hypothetical protein XELAEV_18043905mg [Xenopus laevis]
MRDLSVLKKYTGWSSLHQNYPNIRNNEIRFQSAALRLATHRLKTDFIVSYRVCSAICSVTCLIQDNETYF